MILGMHGKKGHGKDAALERMQRLHPDVFTHHSFAAKMKASAAALLGIDLETMERLKRDEEYNFLSLWDPELSEETGSPILEMTMRTFLQRYGTESHRDIFGQTFWVDLAIGPAVENAKVGYVPVFTDCRFENEAKAVLENGGIVLHIVGPEPDCTCDQPRDYLDTKPKCPRHDEHASEIPLPPHLITATIDNTRRDDGFMSLDRQLLEAITALNVLENV